VGLLLGRKHVVSEGGGCSSVLVAVRLSSSVGVRSTPRRNVTHQRQYASG